MSTLLMVLLLNALCLAIEGKTEKMFNCIYSTKPITNYGSSTTFFKLLSRKNY